MTTFSKLQIPVTFDSGAEIDIDSSTSEISRLAQSADGSVSAIYQNPSVINMSVSSVTGLQSALDLKATKASLSVLDASLKSTGIDVEAGQIHINSSNTYIGNGTTYPIQITSDGKISASSVEATTVSAVTLETTDTGNGHTVIKNDEFTIYGSNGKPGIKISTDSSGNAIMLFYNDGSVAWSISGAGGLEQFATDQYITEVAVATYGLYQKRHLTNVIKDTTTVSEMITKVCGTAYEPTTYDSVSLISGTDVSIVQYHARRNIEYRVTNNNKVADGSWSYLDTADKTLDGSYFIWNATTAPDSTSLTSSYFGSLTLATGWYAIKPSPTTVTYNTGAEDFVISGGNSYYLIDEIYWEDDAVTTTSTDVSLWATSSQSSNGFGEKSTHFGLTFNTIYSDFMDGSAFFGMCGQQWHDKYSNGIAIVGLNLMKFNSGKIQYNDSILFDPNQHSTLSLNQNWKAQIAYIKG